MKTPFLIIVLVLLSHFTFSQNHPGNPGEDAPGGEIVKIKSSDIEVYGVLYKPDTISGKLPAIVVIHGWTPYNFRGGEAHTYFAKEISKRGFITIAITLRGWKDTGGKDDCGLRQPEDVANVVRWLSNHPNVDPAKIGLLGQSLGGQVALSAGALESTVKAIVAYFPVTDFKLWGETTNLDQSALDDYIYGMCQEEGTPADRSPILSSHKINASVLFMHGDQDKNIILDHSERMYDKMLRNKQEVELFIAKNGGHGSHGPGWENHFNIMINYFSRNLGQ